MTQLFFMDESGHDRRYTPYEVRGGFSIHVSNLWPFVQKIKALEIECFGSRLEEIKGSSLLKKNVFEWASRTEELSDKKRRKLAEEFLKNKTKPTREQFTAYGQACLAMANGIVKLLAESKAEIFASAIPRNVKIPPKYPFDDYLQRDAVFLFERFFYLLEEKNEHCVIVMDETEKKQDQRFMGYMENYFTRTENGRERAKRIVPAPFFVSSDMAVAVQVADLCIYAINWGVRLPDQDMNAKTRPEIETMLGNDLINLQFRKGQKFGIVFVPDPYSAT